MEALGVLPEASLYIHLGVAVDGVKCQVLFKNFYLVFQEKREIRGKEIADGTLDIPREPSMMYVYFGKQENYNPDTGELKDGKFRYVIYIPFATTESTGLPDKPHAPGMPWLMDPGTHRAHIMVGPFN